MTLSVVLSVQGMESVCPINTKEAGGAAERWNERPQLTSLRIIGGKPAFVFVLF